MKLYVTVYDEGGQHSRMFAALPVLVNVIGYLSPFLLPAVRGGISNYE